MPFTNGTATDWIDLVARLRTYLTANGWTSLQYTAGNVTTGGMSLNLQGPGAAADKQVYVNIQSVLDDSLVQYAWEFRGALSYVSGSPWGTQPSESPPTYFALWKSTIKYWFYVNDRRFIVVAKVNTVYLSMYAGFLLPWATPAQNPFPLFLGGSDGLFRPYNSTNTAHRMFVDPGGALTGTDYCGGKIRKQDGSWQRVANHNAGSSNEAQMGFAGTTPFVYPYGSRFAATAVAGTDGWIAPGGSPGAGVAADLGVFDNMVATAQGERVLLPVSVMDYTEPGGIAAFDGVYCPCGGGLTPEQTATFGARSFMMFPNIGRTSPNDFFAVEEV